MSSDLISVISKCINDFEEKHSPIVIAYSEYAEMIIELVRGDRYKCTEIFFDTPRNTTRQIRKQTSKHMTRKGLIMYYNEDIKTHETDFEINCGLFYTTIFKGDYADTYEEDSPEFTEACIEKLEWCLDFQKECFE